jgi:inositol-pentakisphosphate 2-kinase
MTSTEDILELPEDAICSYLAEGNANILFRLSFPPSSPLITEEPWLIVDKDASDDGNDSPLPTEIPMIKNDPIFNHKLLRLRKSNGLAADPEVQVLEKFKQLKEFFEPLLTPDLILEQHLVKLPAHLVKNLNTQLTRLDEASEDVIPARRRKNSFLEETEQYAFLVEDMTPAFDQDILLEFKPKWLVQSPSAPSDWKRCRTCALQARRDFARGSVSTEPQSRICPLDLASGDLARVRKAVQGIVDRSKAKYSAQASIIVDKATEFLIQTPLIARLTRLQSELDQKGPLKADLGSLDYIKCMTLRDCTVFLKVRLTPHGA